MQSRQTRLRSKDGHLIFVRIWEPKSIATPIRGVVHISHGMAEHSARYADLAKTLTAQGLVVVAHDHRGHGESLNAGVVGHYADVDGWQRVIADVANVHDFISKEFPGQPLFLFGHSMGSFIVMQYLIAHPLPIQGLIMSGSNYSAPIKYVAAARIAKLERLRQGKQGKSALLRLLTFGSFNNRFKPVRTNYDWLSRSNPDVDRYLQDPHCGFDCTNQLWLDLFGGLYAISQAKNLKKIPADLPIYVFGGSDDPVSEHSKGLVKLADKLKETHHHKVSLKIYQGGRHEMLNELNREEVTADLLAWIEQQLPIQSQTPASLSA